MSIPSTDPEFKPLLTPGSHPVTMAELMEMCVTNFPLSSTRPGIIAGFTYLLGRLQKAEVSGQVWINGSFVTEKIDPNDVDFVLCVFADLYDNSTGEQRAVLDAIAD